MSIIELGEAVGEFVADLQLAGRAARTVEGHQVVPMHPDLVRLLEAWRSVQSLDGKGFVFSLDGRQFVADRVGKICSR